MSKTVLHINSSGRFKDSVTRQVSNAVIMHLQDQHAELIIDSHDLANGEAFITADWIQANFTAAEERNPAQTQVLAHSTALVRQLQQADYVLIASPIYNFSIPAALKAWIDQIARARLTFEYTANGPIGLLQNKKAILVMASGGVPIGSELDFATPYLQQLMRFIGIDDITVIDANDFTTNRLQNIQAFATATHSIVDQEPLHHA